MKNGVFLVVALVASLIVSACTSPSPTTRAVAATAIPDYCKKVVRPSGERFYRCKVKLTVNDGQLSMSVDPFLVPSDLPVVAVWVITQTGYYFGVDDGIFVATQSGQFAEPCASDDDGTCTTVSMPTRYKWRVKNTDAFSSPYCIQFHDVSGTSYAFDPTIANSLAFGMSSLAVAKAGGVCQ